MSLIRLDIHNFRNIISASLYPVSGVNIIYGKNGSGKTSILEAIYFLAHNRSFKSRLIKHITNKDMTEFSLFGQLQAQEQAISVGISRQNSGESKIRIANETIQKSADLAELMPVQVINPDSYRILESGPKYRRQFLDWGLFHVEQSFFQHWKSLQRLLKQRNAALKQVKSYSELQVWDEELQHTAQQIDALRKEYITGLVPVFNRVFSNLLQCKDVSLDYVRGWDQQADYIDVLKHSFERDSYLGYTQYGPQRADLSIKINKVPIYERFSRGQQKLLLVALRLAQGILLREQAQKSCIYLVDDLAAELDETRQAYVCQVLVDLAAQVFVTCVTQNTYSESFSDVPHKLFHVEHGIFQEVETGECSTWNNSLLVES